MTDEELEKKFAHIHDRFDYLAGQIEHISKADLLERFQEAGNSLTAGLNGLSDMPRRLAIIERAMSALAWDRDNAEERRARRRTSAALRKEIEAPSIWEMLHTGEAIRRL